MKSFTFTAMAFVLGLSIGPVLALDPPKPISELSPSEQRAFEQQQKKWLETVDTKKLSPESLIELEVERVIDGDTIVASGRKIRLWGIDAPERGHSHYMAATWFLEGLLKDDPKVSCKFIEKDRYERDVMHCSSQGMDIGSLMVQMGLAEDYQKYSGGYYQHEEQLAKNSGNGIWPTQP